MNPTAKAELVSITHTFIAVAGAAVMSNINTLDVAHLSKDALIAFGIAVLRSVVKTMWNTYSPAQTPATV